MKDIPGTLPHGRNSKLHAVTGRTLRYFTTVYTIRVAGGSRVATWRPRRATGGEHAGLRSMPIADRLLRAKTAPRSIHLTAGMGTAPCAFHGNTPKEYYPPLRSHSHSQSFRRTAFTEVSMETVGVSITPTSVPVPLPTASRTVTERDKVRVGMDVSIPYITPDFPSTVNFETGCSARSCYTLWEPLAITFGDHEGHTRHPASRQELQASRSDEAEPCDVSQLYTQ